MPSLPWHSGALEGFAEIAEAVGLLDQALRFGAPGPYQLQATIAVLHAQAPSADRTDWAAIAGLYSRLLELTPSPVVALNHAVAVAMSTSPAEGLALNDRIDGLDRYHLLHSARADLLRRLGRTTEATASYRRAHDLATKPADAMREPSYWSESPPPAGRAERDADSSGFFSWIIASVRPQVGNGKRLGDYGRSRHAG